MRNIKCVILFLVIILYLIISNIFLIPNFSNIYYILINPLFWLLMFIMCFAGCGENQEKINIDFINLIICIIYQNVKIYT